MSGDRTHENLKSQVLREYHGMIYRHWVRPLQQKLIKRDAAASDSGRFSDTQQALLRRSVNAGRLAIVDFRVAVERFTADEQSVVYIGDGKAVNELVHVLKANAAALEKSGRTFVWQVPDKMQKFAKAGDLVIYERFPASDWRRHAPYTFCVPTWVEQVLDIARPLDEILAGMNQNLRRNLRKVQQNGFEYSFSTAHEEFDRFYHQMYVPYIRHRHAEWGEELASYDDAQEEFLRGGLILVTHNGVPINAMLCKVYGSTCFAGIMGVHEGQFAQVQAGANVALWWGMLEWARMQGLHHFDFGSSRPFISNGVFNFKRQWGTRVRRHADLEAEFVFFANEIAPVLQRHLNDIGIIAEKAGKHYRVVFVDAVEEPRTEMLQQLRRSAASSGVDGLLIFTAAGGQPPQYEPLEQG